MILTCTKQKEVEFRNDFAIILYLIILYRSTLFIMRLNDVVLNDSRITILSCFVCCLLRKIIAFNHYSRMWVKRKKNIFGEYIIFELILNVKLMSGIEQVACH